MRKNPKPRRIEVRRRGVSPVSFYAMFVVLVVANVVTGLALVMSPDIAALLNGKTDAVVSAYEDRIAELRLEVDRLYSRQYAQAGDVNLQLQDLSQAQELLLEQQQYVKALAAKASELGLGADPDTTPAPDPTLTGSISISTETGSPGIVGATAAVEAMMEESRMALASIASEATVQTDAIAAEFSQLGLGLDLPVAELEGVGGPLLPPVDGAPTSSLMEDANAVLAALTRFKAARTAVDTAPIHMPIAGVERLSSSYGNRTDPFTGKKAFHSGLDFPAAKGTLVLSAGAGKVVFAGQRSGYGNVMEIDHGDGYITRYAHLSAFIATVGQRVNTGTPIAKVGSTGRSTGPHLHFEVRDAGAPLDPATFLKAGKRLLLLVSA
ncbi:MAG: hypothetical protein JWR75_265 [Devosia sp.]|nr:hypothetical protein [Devosia sp.]